MAAVPQKTLNWLWNVLQREYRDPQRTYSDVAQTLALYPGLAPRTDAYTFENGVSALLLHLDGTLPVTFRGSQYRFPIAMWIPQAYPYESPILYVKPTEDMAIRPGQHVSASDGRIYHPYLARWRDSWERSSITDFLKLLSDIFAREPPVMSRQHQQSMPPGLQISSQPDQPGPPRPPLPVQQTTPSPRPPSAIPGPPQPPPKQLEQPNGAQPTPTVPQEPPRLGRYDAPPPLPGRGPSLRPQSVASPPQPGYQPQPQYQSQRPGGIRDSYPPTLRPQQAVSYTPQKQSMAGSPSPMQIYQQPPLPPGQSPQNPSYHPPPPPPPREPQPRQASFQPRHGYQPQEQRLQPEIQASKPKPQLPNLMDESPFDITLRSSTANLPTPAIPPNPEKQHILQTLQSTLLTTLQNQVTQNNSALAPLQAQHQALVAAQQSLQQELTQLQGLQAQLQSNVSSLTATIASADRTITSARNSSSPENIPVIDDLIIPPTVVARQLYDCVAEQRGYEAAIFALTEGFSKGRIAGELWARKTRECAREEFRRKWLVRRIGAGMGLDAT